MISGCSLADPDSLYARLAGIAIAVGSGVSVEEEVIVRPFDPALAFEHD